jgi:signal transduction histidine kinase
MKVREKWRPSVGLVLALVLTTILALPLVGLFFFRIYENQLIHQTEAELIGQSAVIAAQLRREIEARLPEDAPLGAAAPPPPPYDPAEPYKPVAPRLDLAGDDVLDRRPPAQPAPTPAAPDFVALGERIAPVLVETQKATLAGFRILDSQGVVIAGREEIGLSLAHIEEVAAALRGNLRAVMRLRISSHEPPPLYSWSRGTGLRIFLAMPVIARGHVAAVVYASRTPSNIFRSFYEERQKIVWANVAMIVLTLLIGFTLHRAITKPMRELTRRTAAAGRGAALTPLAHYGTREFAQLSQSFFDMAESLRARSDFIATFAAHVSHELKSPLTAIQGAAELLRDDLDAHPSMEVEERRRFLDNIIGDAQRLTVLVQRLRDLARAENSPVGGETEVAAVLAAMRGGSSALAVEGRGALDLKARMSAENLRIILAHLADNAQAHGAGRFTVTAARERGAMLGLIVDDDGEGISPNNREKIFEQFFTTRRDSGGTGMGLPIVRAMLVAHGGSIELGEGGGATFVLRLPLAEPAP